MSLWFVPTSRHLNVVVRSPPLYPWGGPKWLDNYPEGPDHPVAPQSSGIISWTIKHSLSTNGPSPSCRQFYSTTAGLSPSETQIEEETLLAIFLLNTGKPGPQRKTDLVPIHSPFGPPKFHRDHVHRRLLPLRPRPVRYYSRLSPKSPHHWRSRMDRWFCPLSIGCRRCRYPCGVRKMLLFLLTVLLSWPCLL